MAGWRRRGRVGPGGAGGVGWGRRVPGWAGGPGGAGLVSASAGITQWKQGCRRAPSAGGRGVIGGGRRWRPSCCLRADAGRFWSTLRELGGSRREVWVKWSWRGPGWVHTSRKSPSRPRPLDEDRPPARPLAPAHRPPPARPRGRGPPAPGPGTWPRPTGLRQSDSGPRSASPSAGAAAVGPRFATGPVAPARSGPFPARPGPFETNRRGRHNAERDAWTKTVPRRPPVPACRTDLRTRAVMPRRPGIDPTGAAGADRATGPQTSTRRPGVNRPGPAPARPGLRPATSPGRSTPAGAGTRCRWWCRLRVPASPACPAGGWRRGDPRSTG